MAFINQKALIEASKEVGRYIVFALISFFLANIGKWINLLQLDSTQETEIVAIGILILRWLDKFLHDKWKDEIKLTDNRLFTGLTPF